MSDLSSASIAYSSTLGRRQRLGILLAAQHLDVALQVSEEAVQILFLRRHRRLTVLLMLQGGYVPAQFGQDAVKLLLLRRRRRFSLLLALQDGDVALQFLQQCIDVDRGRLRWMPSLLPEAARQAAGAPSEL